MVSDVLRVACHGVASLPNVSLVLAALRSAPGSLAHHKGRRSVDRNNKRSHERHWFASQERSLLPRAWHQKETWLTEQAALLLPEPVDQLVRWFKEASRCQLDSTSVKPKSSVDGETHEAQTQTHHLRPLQRRQVALTGQSHRFRKPVCLRSYRGAAVLLLHLGYWTSSDELACRADLWLFLGESVPFSVSTSWWYTEASNHRGSERGQRSKTSAQGTKGSPSR